MIRKMKQIVLLCLEKDRQTTLDRLGELAVLHVSVERTAGEAPDAVRCRKKLEDLQKVCSILSDAGKTPVREEKLSPAVCRETVLKILEERSSLQKENESLCRMEEELLPWGDFDPETLAELEKNGLYVSFARVPKKSPPELPETVTPVVISEAGPQACVLYLSEEKEWKAEGLIPLALPKKSLTQIRKELRETAERQECLTEHLSALRVNLPALMEEKIVLEEDLAFAEAAASMTGCGQEGIVQLSGYVPEIHLESLRQEAAKSGWALMIEDPAPDDPMVPTYITKPKWLSIIDPLFDFIGVAPGYREHDVSVFFLIFFPIFFGMIIGDAVYGLLFLTAALTGKIVLRKKEAARLPLNLFLMLSCSSIIWGFLNGSWAGLPASVLPRWMQGIDFLTHPEDSLLAVSIARKVGFLKPDVKVSLFPEIFDSVDWSGKITQWFCFFLAAVHLSAARIFKFAEEVRSDWRAFGHLGWALLLIANFLMAASLIVFPGTFPVWGYGLYGLGTVLVILTISAEDALNLPFSLIGSFTDVLSYIRLYAVGLAGALIAIKFNEMALMITNGRHGLPLCFAFIGFTAVILLGHLLNIALSFLSVLVHAIRLNTLEFSSHAGLQWAGVFYKPFRKKQSNPTQNKL